LIARSQELPSELTEAWDRVEAWEKQYESQESVSEEPAVETLSSDCCDEEMSDQTEVEEVDAAIASVRL
jgi:hypothetical protein